MTIEILWETKEAALKCVNELRKKFDIKLTEKEKNEYKKTRSNTSRVRAEAPSIAYQNYQIGVTNDFGGGDKNKFNQPLYKVSIEVKEIELLEIMDIYIAHPLITINGERRESIYFTKFIDQLRKKHNWSTF